GLPFDPDNVATLPIGRSLTSMAWLQSKPIGEVVYHLASRTREQLLEGLSQRLPAAGGEFDAHDVHLVAAAVERGADVICRSNRRHMPEGPLAASIEVVGPGRLVAELGVRCRQTPASGPRLPCS